MKKIEFSAGGYVLHRATVPGSVSRFSAWFDAAGTLIDAERIDRRDRSYAPGRLQRERLQAVGKVYAARPADRVSTQANILQGASS